MLEFIKKQESTFSKISEKDKEFEKEIDEINLAISNMQQSEEISKITDITKNSENNAFLKIFSNKIIDNYNQGQN